MEAMEEGRTALQTAPVAAVVVADADGGRQAPSMKNFLWWDIGISVNCMLRHRAVYSA